jgi:hypothetical protein
MKSVFAGLLCLIAFNAFADTGAAATAASGAIVAPKADDYIECANLYFMYGQMDASRPKPTNLTSYIGMASVLATVSSSEQYVNKHQGPMLAAELKRLKSAQDADATATYLANFMYRMNQCAGYINQGNTLLKDKVLAYTASHPAPAAASGK